MAQTTASGRTLTIDVGGTAIKFGVVDDSGDLSSEPGVVPTGRPCSPDTLLAQLDQVVAGHRHLGWDRIVIGFPGPVRDGRVVSALQFWRDGPAEVPELRSEWEDFDLATAASVRWTSPTVVVNDAILHGAAVVGSRGVELVVTLDTGFGSSLWVDGRPVPLDLALHPFVDGESYTAQLCDAALARVGQPEWTERVKSAVCLLESVFNVDALFVGGGNARLLASESFGPASWWC